MTLISGFTSGYIHYVCQQQQKCVEDPCDPNPCGVGANCALDASDGFTCKCPSGTIGDGRILCAQESDLLSLLKNSKINLDSSTSEEPSIGFKDCGKRLSERENGLGFSNGQSVSTQQVILNHIYVHCKCLQGGSKNGILNVYFCYLTQQLPI